jgi:hypothetical protein
MAVSVAPTSAVAVAVSVPAAAFCAQWLSSFRDFPPRFKPASFSLDKVMDQMATPVHKN